MNPSSPSAECIIPVTRHKDPAGPRTLMDVLVDIADLLTRELAAIEHLRSALRESSESRSSASVKDSTRGYDLDVKSYADGLLPAALDEAICEYARGKRELKALADSGWAETVETLKQARTDRETEVAAGRRWSEAQEQFAKQTEP